MEARSDAKERLLELLRRDAWRHGSFLLASGRQSDFFIDCKVVALTAEGHRLVGEAVFEELATREAVAGGWGAVDCVAGVELGGCSLASAVALTSHLRGRAWNALYVRKAPKDHGTLRRVEGLAQPGARVVLLEDVLTTGGSSRSAVEALTAAGYRVAGVLALVDRREGAVAALEAAGVPASALFSREDFVP